MQARDAIARLKRGDIRGLKALVRTYSELFGLSLPPGEGVYAHVFDASALPVTDGDLTLTLAMGLTELPPPSDASADPGTEQPEGLSSPAIELTPLPPAKSVGPFTFQFSLTR